MVANFSELRKAEVQLPRRPSATTTFVRPLTLSLVGARGDRVRAAPRFSRSWSILLVDHQFPQRGS
jgi:hypothetical protein